MNRNIMIIMAGGFLIAILVALMVQATLSGGKDDAPVQVKEEAKVQILVAAKDLGAGAILDDKQMEWREWPEQSVFKGAIVRAGDKKPTEMVSGTLKRGVAEGEPIMAVMVVAGATENFLSVMLTPGKRAVSVNVDASSMVAGFARPGDYVDVIVVYQVNTDDIDDPQMQSSAKDMIDENAAETIIQNVKVLAVDQTTSRSKDDLAKVGRTITLELSPEQAEQIAVADEFGDLKLSLRRIGDDDVRSPKSAIVTDRRILGIYGEIVDGAGSVSGGVSAMPDNFNAGQGSGFVRIDRGEAVQAVPSR